MFLVQTNVGIVHISVEWFLWVKSLQLIGWFFSFQDKFELFVDTSVWSDDC